MSSIQLDTSFRGQPTYRDHLAVLHAATQTHTHKHLPYFSAACDTVFGLATPAPGVLAAQRKASRWPPFERIPGGQSQARPPGLHMELTILDYLGLPEGSARFIPLSLSLGGLDGAVVQSQWQAAFCPCVRDPPGARVPCPAQRPSGL